MLVVAAAVSGARLWRSAAAESLARRNQTETSRTELPEFCLVFEMAHGQLEVAMIAMLYYEITKNRMFTLQPSFTQSETIRNRIGMKSDEYPTRNGNSINE
jgi:hypothetical protein